MKIEKETIMKKLNYNEFRDICKKNGVTNFTEIHKRWSNYLMFISNGHFDRTAHEVGAQINDEELYD